MRQIEDRGEVLGMLWLKHRFALAGDQQVLHTHVPGAEHLTVIVEGRFRLLGAHERSGEEVGPGSVLAWEAGVPHGFEALVPESVLVQVWSSADLALGRRSSQTAEVVDRTEVLP